MPIIDTYGFKWKLDKPYLTPPEAQMLKKLRAGGKLSAFRVTRCEGVKLGKRCENEIPKVPGEKPGDPPLKRFCSKACYDTIHPEAEEQDNNDDDA